LGELGAEVVAVEGSVERARLAGLRCQEQENVTILAEDLSNLELETEFDWVLLIGVLEYAPMFLQGATPLASCLQRVARYAANHGRVAVAIENKLGLKYFAGFPEDHLQRDFWGIQGLYRSRDPTTLGRAELASLFSSCGLTHQRFLYPFPDYKLPQVVLEDEALTRADFGPHEFLVGLRSADGGFDRRPLFSEALVFRELSRNGVLRDFSNSFLVVGSRCCAWSGSMDALAHSFATERRAEFATHTRIADSARGLIVEKTRLSDAARPPIIHAGGLEIEHSVGTEPFAAGSSPCWDIATALARGEQAIAVFDSQIPWLDYLLSQALVGATSVAACSLPGDLIDAGPHNVRVGAAGVTVFDREWVSRSPVPLAWVLLRGVGVNLHRAGYSPVSVRAVSESVVRRLCGMRNLCLTSHDCERAWRLEREFISGVMSGLSPDSLAQRSLAHLSRRFPRLARRIL
jgi:hypothetical protein